MQWKFRALWAPLRGCAMIHQHWCHNSPNERKSPPAGRRRKAAALPTNETDCPVSRLRARLNCPVLNNQPFVPGLCPAAFIPGVPAAEAALAMRHHYVCWLQHFMRGWPAAAAGAQTLHAATLPRAQFSFLLWQVASKAPPEPRRDGHLGAAAVPHSSFQMLLAACLSVLGRASKCADAAAIATRRRVYSSRADCNHF